MWPFLNMILKQILSFAIVQGFQKSKIGQDLVKKVTNFFNKFKKDSNAE